MTPWKGDDVATPALGDGAGSEMLGRWMVLVILGERSNVHYLRDTGRYVVGRSEKADIRIDDPSVSRQHAVLHVDDTVRVEDLGSANGTRLAQAAVSPGELVEVFPGDVIDLGAAMVVLQQGPQTRRPRRLHTHDYFEVRLEEECVRARLSGGHFGLLRVGTGPEVPERTVATAILGQLRPTDVMAEYSPGVFEVLLAETARERTEETLRRIEHQLRARGGFVRIGMACYPHDGREPEVLSTRIDASLRGEAKPEGALPGIVVASPAMERLHQLVGRVASCDLPVLFLGETGVGKEVLAESLHRLSPRAERSFLRLNCAALSDTLLESELFGHVKGAFTGADQSRPGLLESADGGTVLLDEVGEMPIATQAKLLRVIENKEILRIGAREPKPIDVRFTAATNRELEEEVEMGRFRRDLFYRLNAITITVPPLRSRPSEIAPLTRAFVTNGCVRDGRRAEPRLTIEALRMLEAYDWPGNVRELRNVVDRALVLCGEDPIGPEHLPQEKFRARAVVEAGADEPARPDAPTKGQPAPGVTVSDTSERAGSAALAGDLEALERQRIVGALVESGGNQTEAAKSLGISRSSLVRRLARFGIIRPRKGRGTAKG